MEKTPLPNFDLKPKRFTVKILKIQTSEKIMVIILKLD